MFYKKSNYIISPIQIALILDVIFISNVVFLSYFCASKIPKKGNFINDRIKHKSNCFRELCAFVEFVLVPVRENPLLEQTLCGE